MILRIYSDTGGFGGLNGSSVCLNGWPVYLNCWPVQVDGSAVGPTGSSVQVDGWPVGLDGRAVRFDGPLVGLNGWPVQGNGPAVGLNEPAVHRNGPAVRRTGASVHRNGWSVGWNGSPGQTAGWIADPTLLPRRTALMATWNSGVIWISGPLWGPAIPPAPIVCGDPPQTFWKTRHPRALWPAEPLPCWPPGPGCSRRVAGNSTRVGCSTRSLVPRGQWSGEWPKMVSFGTQGQAVRIVPPDLRVALLESRHRFLAQPRAVP